MHCYATKFSRKTILCETNNIFYSLGKQNETKTVADPKSTSKASMGSPWAVLQILICQQLFAVKRFCMETRFSNILKATNAANFIKTILESMFLMLH